MQDLQAQTEEQEGDEASESLDVFLPAGDEAGEAEGEQGQQQQQQDASSPAPRAQAPLSLSKSWSVRKAHVPLYTGGPIHHCPSHNVLLTPVGGDIAVVDCAAGVQLCTVRRGNGSSSSSNNDNQADAEEEEEDDQLDADAITAYAVNHNENLLLTCSHNSFLRQYFISSTTDEKQREDADADADHDQQQQHPQRKVKIVLQKTWGKSGHTLPVTDMQFHRSGVFVATASVDGSVRVWDVRGGFVTHVYRPGSSSSSSSSSGMLRAVTALQWFPDVQQLVLAIGRDDGSIAIHNLRDNSSSQQQQPQAAEASSGVVVLRDHVSAVTCLEWDTDRSIFVSTGRDAVINLWRYHYESSSSSSKNAAGKKKTKKRKPKSQHQQQTTVNTIPTYRRIHTLPIYEQVEGMVLLNTQDNESLIATAGTKGQIRLWKMAQVKTNEGIGSYQLSLFSAQSVSEAFGEARGGYVNLRYSDNRQFKNVAGTSPSSSAAEQLIVADAENNITFINLSPLLPTSKTTNKDAGTVLSTDRTIVGHNDEILDLKVIPHSQQKVVVATNSAQVRIFDLNSFSCEHVLDRHSATVLCVDVSPCGRFIATCGKDKQMRIWRQQPTTTMTIPPSRTHVVWQCVAVASGHTEAVGTTAFSRKVGRYEVCGKAARNGGGAFVVTASMDRTLKRWNLPGAKDLLLLLLEPKEDVSAKANNADVRAEEEQQLDLKTFASTRAHEKDINIVSVAPNDSLIATGSQDKTVKLWKANTLSLVATLKGHRRGVWDCQFSPFDRVLATGSGDKAIKLWSLSDFSCVRTFQGHVASVLRVRFLSGGLQLVSSGADGLVKLWTVRTNECEATMDAHRDKIWALDLDATGKQLISGGADSQIVVWEDTTEEVEDAKRFEEEEAILVEQKLANHLRHKEYAEALEISLERDKPYQTLKVLNAIIEGDLQKGESGLASLKVYARKWSTDRIVRVLRYCREWNTRAQNSHVALLVVKAIVSTVPVHVLAATDGVPEILAGIIPYAERHFERLDRLHSSSYLLDFALSSMGVIEASDEEEDFAVWESSAKLVLPPKRADGRVDVGGSIVVGASLNDRTAESSSDDDYAEQDEEVITIGDSDSDEE